MMRKNNFLMEKKYIISSNFPRKSYCKKLNTAFYILNLISLRLQNPTVINKVGRTLHIVLEEVMQVIIWLS